MRVDDDETIIEIIFAWINDVLMHLSIEIENRRPAVAVRMFWRQFRIAGRTIAGDT